MREIKVNDIVEFKFRDKNLKGIVKDLHKSIAKVRVLKNSKPLWHEYIKTKNLHLVKVEE